MANSKITFTFTGDPIDNDNIQFRIYRFETPTFFSNLIETYLDAGRVANLTVPTVTTTNPPYPTAGSASAYIYQYYFNIDHNNTGLFNITWNANVVVIEFVNDLWGISNVTVPSNVSYVIDNGTPITYSIVSTEINTASSDFCNKIQSSIETDELSTKITLNGIILTTTNLANPYLYDINRGIINNFILENAAGNQLTYTPNYIDYLTSENITINVTPFLTGATVSVTTAFAQGLSLEYSLDNVNWQTSNSFTGQEPGTKFLYVRDQYGCVKSKEYTVTALGTRTPYAYISKANSIPFIQLEDINGVTTFYNEENTFNYNSLSGINFCENSLFTTNDITKIQIKSNFETVAVSLRNEDLTETPINVIKRSSNLNRFLSLDGKYYKYRDGKLGVYFENGNTYDENQIVNGTFDLSGNLPDFAIIGQQITVGTLGTYKIVDKLYDEDINKWAIIINYTYEGSIGDAIITSIYDVLAYEIYEFIINWSTYDTGIYDITVTNTDTINDTILLQSENIELAESYDKTAAIYYYNDNNRDIFYKYGIQHFIRAPYQIIKSLLKNDNEINITDNDVDVIESTVNDGIEIIFDYLTRDKMKNLLIALSSENLFINGLGYVKDGAIEAENIGNTNRYSVTAKLIRTGFTYTNKDSGDTGRAEDYVNFDIPQIITDGTNFIKA